MGNISSRGGAAQVKNAQRLVRGTSLTDGHGAAPLDLGLSSKADEGRRWLQGNGSM